MPLQQCCDPVGRLSAPCEVAGSFGVLGPLQTFDEQRRLMSDVPDRLVKLVKGISADQLRRCGTKQPLRPSVNRETAALDAIWLKRSGRVLPGPNLRKGAGRKRHHGDKMSELLWGMPTVAGHIAFDFGLQRRHRRPARHQIGNFFTGFVALAEVGSNRAPD